MGINLNEVYAGKYVSKFEISGLPVKERLVTILGNPKMEEVRVTTEFSKMQPIIDVQFAHDKRMKPLRVTQRIAEALKPYYGPDLDKWTGKMLELITVEYQEGKYTLGAKPYTPNEPAGDYP